MSEMDFCSTAEASESLEVCIDITTTEWESQMERDHWEDQGIGGWTILKWILEVEWDDMDWIDLAQDGDQLRAHVNIVINLWVP
jgi:hypothetical protein